MCDCECGSELSLEQLSLAQETFREYGNMNETPIMYGLPVEITSEMTVVKGALISTAGKAVDYSYKTAPVVELSL